jgi:carboxymethylenebutenolidase
VALDELANTQIPCSDDGYASIHAHVARPKSAPEDAQAQLPLLILIHEFFGLTSSIVDKAQLLADELDCLVVAPDTYRGVTTSFIPRAIWLALRTPQERVNRDLEDVVTWAAGGRADTKRIAVVGFCYGGGKAIRYTTQVRPTAATVVWYGKPITDAEELSGLRAPVCAVYGCDDKQFPQALVDRFREALEAASIEHEVVSYFGAGHAFFSDVGQVEREEMPVIAGWRLTTNFLRGYFSGAESFSKKRAFLEYMLAQQRAAQEGAGDEYEEDVEEEDNRST